jgi:glycogen operon protein
LANGENNEDGHDDNRSWNCGVEGPTDDPDIQNLRAQLRRGLLTALFLSQGTPMMLMGDEVGHSQQGNNNAYCQDNELSWLDWESISERDQAFLDYMAGLIRLRERCPLLRQPGFLHGEPAMADGTKDVTWLRPDGEEMTEDDWINGFSRSISLMLAEAASAPLLILLNAHHEPVEYRTTRPDEITSWRLLVDSARGLIEPEEPDVALGGYISMPGRGILLFQGRLA